MFQLLFEIMAIGTEGFDVEFVYFCPQHVAENLNLFRAKRYALHISFLQELPPSQVAA